MTDKRQRRGTANPDDPPAIWLGYGKLLKLHRRRAGMTQEQLAGVIVYSLDMVSAVERGKRPAKLPFTQAAERVLDAGGTLLALQEDVDLARLPRFFHDFATLEAEAISFFWYGGYVVPGLLQTEDYARALLNAHFPPLDEDTLEERLAARMDRQAQLKRTKPPLVAVFLIEEAVLYRPMGGPDVMKAQLRKLLEQTELPNIQIQIMPTSFGAHSGLNGSMVLLETTDHTKVAYVESQDVSSVVSEPDMVSEFWLRYGMLRSQALNLEESARLIKRAAGEP